jgi:hypothetical protein
MLDFLIRILSALFQEIILVYCLLLFVSRDELCLIFEESLS